MSWPGWGHSQRQISREPSGRDDGAAKSSSATQAPSRSGAITVDRLQPRRFGHFEDRCADRVVEPIADRETDPPASRQSAVNACV